jgi:hypothetical protein
MAMVNEDVESLKHVMAQNIDSLLEKEQRLEDLDEQSSALQELSKQFKKNTLKVKRFKMWQNAKHGVLVGSAVTAGAAVVIVPPLIMLALVGTAS